MLSNLSAFPLPPWSSELGQPAQLAVPKLDVHGSYHPGLQLQRRPYSLVNIRRGVVAHDEIMAVCVAGLMDGQGFGEGEDAPVRQAADDAVSAENERTDCVCDSIHGKIS